MAFSYDIDVLVVGGGPAGMTAAIAAARQGARVTLLERMQRVGKKLLATGNGRCNLSNSNLDEANFHGAWPGFAMAVLRQFDLEATLRFFHELGVPVVGEPDGKLYPHSGQASSVLDVLRYEMERLGVAIVADTRAQSVTALPGGFECQCTNGFSCRAARVVVAAGGQAVPNLGSNGTGFKIAQALGHSLIEPFPTLVQVCVRAPYLKHLAGLRLEGEVSVWLKGACARRKSGEVLFADYGLSGPPVLQVSRLVAEKASEASPVELRLDLFPEDSEEGLAEFLRNRVAGAPQKTGEFGLVGWLHKRLIPVVLRQAGIEDLQRCCGDWSDAEIRSLAGVLKHWRMEATGTKSWMDAQVTAGGVDVAEVEAETLESRIVPGVYFCGEVLDVDGDSGGYNLQWAWSSGYVAGAHAGRAARG